MTVVVSANYRDRSQKNWLVRKADESIDNYQLRDMVVVKDFMFCDSHAGETGFGCTVVAQGELVEESELDRASLVRIEFDGARFREVDGGRRIDGGSLLVLDGTGMYYLPA